METYSVHIRMLDFHEDVLVKATSRDDAVDQARKLTTLPARLARWAHFVI